MKVVVLDGFLAGYGLNGLPLPDTFKIKWYDNTPPEQTIERIGTAEAVFVNRLRLDARGFEACPSLRFAGTFGTGYNMIDLDAARRAGVTVCNVPAYSTAAVAQNTISLLLNIATMTHIHSRYVSTGHWTDPTDHALVSVPMFELAGKTIGLIGCGDIGSAVGRIAAAFGMRVLAYRRHPDPSAGAYIRFVALDALYAQSDIVSLHCPLTPQTRGMIDRAAIGRMKDGAVLLNTARGGLLCERRSMSAGSMVSNGYVIRAPLHLNAAPRRNAPVIRMLDFFDFGNIISSLNQPIRRISPGHHKLEPLRLLLHKAAQQILVDELTGQRAHHLVEHQQVARAGARLLNGGEQIFCIEIIRLLQFTLIHLKRKFFTRLAAQHRNARNMCERAQLSGFLTFEKLHQQHLHPTARRAYRQAGCGCCLSLTVAAVNMNKPFHMPSSKIR